MNPVVIEQVSGSVILAELRACEVAERQAAARRLAMGCEWARRHPGIDAVPAEFPADLSANGSTDPLGARRHALGVLARNADQPPEPASGGQSHATSNDQRRQTGRSSRDGPQEPGTTASAHA